MAISCKILSMNYVFQFGVLCAVYYIGEVISSVSGLPVPGSVIGLLIMLLLLRTGLLKPRYVEDAADFLIRAMPVMFLPITTGLMVSYGLLAGSTAAFLAITMLSTVVAFAATGLTAQAIIRRSRRREAVPSECPPAHEDGPTGGTT